MTVIDKIQTPVIPQNRNPSISLIHRRCMGPIRYLLAVVPLFAAAIAQNAYAADPWPISVVTVTSSGFKSDQIILSEEAMITLDGGYGTPEAHEEYKRGEPERWSFSISKLQYKENMTDAYTDVTSAMGQYLKFEATDPGSTAKSQSFRATPLKYGWLQVQFSTNVSIPACREDTGKIDPDHSWAGNGKMSHDGPTISACTVKLTQIDATDYKHVKATCQVLPYGLTAKDVSFLLWKPPPEIAIIASDKKSGSSANVPGSGEISTLVFEFDQTKMTAGQMYLRIAKEYGDTKPLLTFSLIKPVRVVPGILTSAANDADTYWMIWTLPKDGEGEPVPMPRGFCLHWWAGEYNGGVSYPGVSLVNASQTSWFGETEAFVGQKLSSTEDPLYSDVGVSHYYEDVTGRFANVGAIPFGKIRDQLMPGDLITVKTMITKSDLFAQPASSLTPAGRKGIATLSWVIVSPSIVAFPSIVLPTNNTFTFDVP